MSSGRSAVTIALALAGLLVAALLLLEHHGESLGAAQAVCGEGPSNGCETVARSAYSSVGGVPLAAIGLGFYWSLASLLALALFASPEAAGAAKRACALAVALALLADVVLFGIQAFVIGAFCRLCLATYVVNALLLASLWPEFRSKIARLATLGRTEGRIILGGWALASLGAAVAVAALNTALSYREAARSTTILGSGPAAVQRAEAEAARLKEILDDPQKREQYVTDKSVKEFEDAVPQSFDLNLPPFSGPAGAPIHVVEFSDYLCPYCRGLAAGFKDYLPKSGGRVIIHYKNYPLDKACNAKLQNTVHEGACWLALGAICAQDLGNFPQYQDKAYSTPQRAMTREDAVRLGVEVGIPAGAMGACLESGKTRDRLLAEISEAERSGVKATPTVFIDGKQLPRLNDFLLAVEKESVRLGIPPLRPPAPAR